jgi:hypothetical protein
MISTDYICEYVTNTMSALLQYFDYIS